MGVKGAEDSDGELGMAAWVGRGDGDRGGDAGAAMRRADAGAAWAPARHIWQRLE